MGVPVCGYAHGGVSEQLDHILPEGKVNVGDLDAVFEVIKAWIKRPPSINKKHEYLLSKMLSRTIAIYEDLSGK